MSVKKKILSGKRVSWGYEFAIGPRGARQRHKQGGYATKNDALNAEAEKRLEIGRAAKVTAMGTLGHAIERFFADRADELSPKTMDRYRELATYVHQDLRGTPITDVRAMDLHVEWKRLLATGGHKRGTGELRPLAGKTVRNIASVVSAACSWAVLYGLITVNPATASKPPAGKKRPGMALAPSQVELLTTAATGWLADFLEVEAGLGIRRGECLALRWSDIVAGEAYVSRSACQVGDRVIFKGTKTDEPRKVEIAASTMAVLERHRAEQAEARAIFPEYDREGDLIFCDPGGAPLKPDSVSSKVSLLFRRLKLPKGASLHTLRHSHASQLVADGADVGAVAKRMGHANAGTTLGIYTHAVPGRRNLAEQWEKLQKGGKTQ